MRSMSRRGFLGLAAGGLLVACGSGSDGGSASGSGSGSAQGAASGDDRAAAALIAFFPQGIYVSGSTQRLPFGLADADAVPLSAGPELLEATIRSEDGKTLQTITAARHAEGLPRAYYPFELALADPGIYSLNAKVDGKELEAMFQLIAPGSLPFPGPGGTMPGFDTPTVADARGVDPLCTRPEPCPFHAMTLNEALATGRPVAYLVGTPAHCQTGICGPVLDLMVTEAERFADVVFVHAEVYADDAATVVAPAVAALGLDFEPLLFLIGADGVVRHRLDVIYDSVELRQKLEDLAA
ncbi:MAG: hypothetical protein IT196_12995 [Acidimicrobiales bacterium]|nr:hypothetical protein [Acidimicrobiales bacterium]